MQWMRATGESYLVPSVLGSTRFVFDAHDAATISLFFAALAALATTILLALVTRWKWAPLSLAALGVIEMFAFARGTLATFDAALVVPAEIRAFLAQHPGDHRVLDLGNPDSAMASGELNLWGYAPDLVRRYAEFVAWTQGSDPDKATQNVSFARLDPLYALLRLRFAFVPSPTGVRVAEAPGTPMPQLQLIQRYRVAQTRDAIFTLLRNESFDPRAEVILEREPEPKPVPNEAAGSARIVNASTDALTIEADLPQPAILLMTDVWTPAWRAVALPGSAQARYDLQPADYILRAVPLSAGHHNLRVEYAPRAFAIGKWLSVFAWIAFTGAVVVHWRKG
jgi:hypothetical protein